MTRYQIRSPLAMCACLISASLSILLLVEPSFDGKFTIHTAVAVAVSAGLVSMAIIMGVLAHGHGLVTAAGAALALLSVSLSGAIVWEQSGRRAQIRASTTVVGADATAERSRLTQLRAEADQILAKHRADQARECASGKGKRCDGISYTVRTWEAAREGYDAKLRGTPSPTPDAKVETIGTAAELLGRDGKVARAWVTLIDPLLVPLLLELAAILCGVVAFGPKPSTGSTLVSHSTVSADQTAGFQGFQAEIPRERPVLEVSETPAPEIVGSQNSETSSRKILSLVDQVDALLVPIVRQRGGKVDNQAHLAKLSGFSEPSISRMLKRSKELEQVWDHHGKCNVIRLKAGR